MLAFVALNLMARQTSRLFGTSVDVDALRAMSVKALRQELGERGLPWGSYIEKSELVGALKDAMETELAFSQSGKIRPGAVAELTGDELLSEIGFAESPLLVDVYAKWCGPCQLMAPELEKAAKELGQRIRVAKLDSDAEPEVSSTLGIEGLPTLLLFKGGKEIERVQGALMKDDLVNLVVSRT